MAARRHGNKEAVRGEKGAAVKIGLRSLLLLIAVVVFVVAIFIDKDQLKWIAAGLAFLAGSFLVGDLAPSLGGRLRRRL